MSDQALHQTLKNQMLDIMPSIRRYPSGIQLKLLKYYLVYLLKGGNENSAKEEVVAQCKILQRTMSVSEEVIRNQSIEDIAMQLGVKIGEQQDENQNLKKIAEKIDELSTVLQKNHITDNKRKLSLSELVNSFSDNNGHSKTILNDSVGAMFDRIFDSFDPANAENYLDQSIVRKGEEHKAALYDAMCEKYEQLYDYHDSGRLLKDFRRLYQENIKNK